MRKGTGPLITEPLSCKMLGVFSRLAPPAIPEIQRVFWLMKLATSPTVMPLKSPRPASCSAT